MMFFNAQLFGLKQLNVFVVELIGCKNRLLVGFEIGNQKDYRAND